MRLSPPIVTALLLLCLSAQAANSRTYIRCDRPVTCCVSYGEDLVTLELHAQDECEFAVWTGFAPQWALLGGQQTKIGWSYGTDGMVLVKAIPGAMVWEFGHGRVPLRGSGPPIPVKLDGKQREQLRTTYAMRRMEARAKLTVPFGLYRVTLVPAYPVSHTAPQPKLRIGGTEIADWSDAITSTGRQALRAASDMMAGGEVGVQLSWRSDFPRSPVREILLETVAQVTELAKTAPPDLEAEGVIIIEAEGFAREGGGGPAQISEGEHADQHGGASIYSFGPGEEHWLEWRFEVPADGKYTLYARTATQEERSLRELTIDGKTPDPGAALLSFPGTGGWARDDASQWAWTTLVGADGRPALDLTAGEHRLRLTTRGIWHVNVDVMALVPAD